MTEVEQLQQAATLSFFIAGLCFGGALFLYLWFMRPAQREIKRLKKDYQERYGDELP